MAGGESSVSVRMQMKRKENSENCCVQQQEVIRDQEWTIIQCPQLIFVTMCRESGQNDFLGLSQSHDFDPHQIAILTMQL
jgi:hypothetical protein